jgi:hypothetical protein
MHHGVVEVGHQIEGDEKFQLAAAVVARQVVDDLETRSPHHPQKRGIVRPVIMRQKTEMFGRLTAENATVFPLLRRALFSCLDGTTGSPRSCDTRRRHSPHENDPGVIARESVRLNAKKDRSSPTENLRAS